MVTATRAIRPHQDDNRGAVTNTDVQTAAAVPRRCRVIVRPSSGGVLSGDDLVERVLDNPLGACRLQGQDQFANLALVNDGFNGQPLAVGKG